MGEITDFVHDEFADTHQDADAATDKLDTLMDELETLPQDVVDAAVAGIVKRTAEKRNGAEAVAFFKRLMPVILNAVAGL